MGGNSKRTKKENTVISSSYSRELARFLLVRSRNLVIAFHSRDAMIFDSFDSFDSLDSIHPFELADVITAQNSKNGVPARDTHT